MSKALTLTIVIPAYNEERHIKACLESIARQAIKPEQVIVVDNNSTDGTAEVARSFDFVTLLHESKQGIAYARDRGYDATTSELIGRIDADTVLSPHWVSYAKRFMSKHSNEILTGGAYAYDLRYSKFFGWVQGQIAFRANRFILGYYIAWGSNMVFRRDMWGSVRQKASHDIGIHEDIDLTILWHEEGYDITYHSGWKVGIDSRFFARHSRVSQLSYLRMWPKTLRTHHVRRAWVGEIGAYMIFYLLYYPILFSEIFGRRKRIDISRL